MKKLKVVAAVFVGLLTLALSPITFIVALCFAGVYIIAKLIGEMIIKKAVAQADAERRRVAAYRSEPAVSAVRMVELALEKLYPDYVWVKKTLVERSGKLVQAGDWFFEIEISAISKSKRKTLEVVFSDGVLVSMTEKREPVIVELPKATNHNTETTAEPVLSVKEVEPVVLEEVEAEVEPAKEFPENIKLMYAETHLSEMQMWLEGEVQNAYLDKTMTFVIPTDMLPDDIQLWAPIVKLLQTERYGYPDASLLPSGLGIEVQIPPPYESDETMPCAEGFENCVLPPETEVEIPPELDEHELPIAELSTEEYINEPEPIPVKQKTARKRTRSRSRRKKNNNIVKKLPLEKMADNAGGK